MDEPTKNIIYLHPLITKNVYNKEGGIYKHPSGLLYQDEKKFTTTFDGAIDFVPKGFR